MVTDTSSLNSLQWILAVHSIRYRTVNIRISVSRTGRIFSEIKFWAVDFFQSVARYDPERQNYTESTAIPWVGGAPPANEPACGYNGACPKVFPEVAVAAGVTIPVLCGLAALFYFYWKQEKTRRKSDHEWIATIRQMQFPKHKKDEFGENTPDNMVDESHQAQDTAAEGTLDLTCCF